MKKFTLNKSTVVLQAAYGINIANVLQAIAHVLWVSNIFKIHAWFGQYGNDPHPGMTQFKFMTHSTLACILVIVAAIFLKYASSSCKNFAIPMGLILGGFLIAPFNFNIWIFHKGALVNLFPWVVLSALWAVLFIQSWKKNGFHKLYALMLILLSVPVGLFMISRPFMNYFLSPIAQEQATYIQTTYHVPENQLSPQQRVDWQATKRDYFNQKRGNKTRQICAVFSILAFAAMIWAGLTSSPLLATELILLTQFINGTPASNASPVHSYFDLILILLCALGILFWGAYRWNLRRCDSLKA